MRTITITGIAVAALATAGSASAQTLTHWLDRQIHGTARHLTPRHHKPGEAPYSKRIKGNLEQMYVMEMKHGYQVTYIVDGRRIVRYYPYARVERQGFN